jgi:chromosome segregation ATPase
MGRAATVTAEQVNSIADALAAEGVKLSSRAVRERLDGNAGLGTISKFLHRRKTNQERKRASVMELPHELRRAVLDFVNEELNEARGEFDAELTEHQQEATDLANENEAQVVTIETQATELESLREELAKQLEAADEARTELAKAKLRLEDMPRLEDAAAAARAELAKAQFKLEGMPRLEAAAEAARAELVKLQVRLEAMNRLEAELGTVKAELEAERTEMVDLRIELDEERDLRIKAQQFIVDPIFKRPVKQAERSSEVPQE